MAVEALDGQMKRFTEQPVDSAVLKVAGTLIESHHLRALDAVQLASAIVSREQLADTTMRFIASDMALLAAARNEGFTTWDPTDD